MNDNFPLPNRSRSCGGIVLGNAGTVVLVRVQDGDGAFLFPKGHVDPGESDEETARREVAEETGLTELELIDDLGTYERFGIDKNGVPDRSRIKEIHMFLFAAARTQLAPTHEVAEARWVPLPDVVNTIGNDRDRAWFVSVFERVRQAIQRD